MFQVGNGVMQAVAPHESGLIARDVEALRTRIRTLEFEALMAELAEEQAIREAEASGVAIQRRPDARLAIVLADESADG